MARAFFINGESLVQVKGRSDSSIGSLSELGLAEGPIRVRPRNFHKDINVDAWGMAPPDVQWMLGDLTVAMTLIHFDPAVLETCLMLSQGGGQASVGQFNRAGTLMGNNTARFGAGNNYIGLNITSPVASRPYRFYYAYLPDDAIDWPLGTEKSVVELRWRVVPFTTDPYGGGTGARNYILWDRTADT